ncbi:MAG: GNAT family N-acetyltransferase [Syntrophomonas sp.]
MFTEYMNTTFKTLKESQEMIDLLNSLPKSKEGMRWAIVDKNSADVMGSCGYHNVKAEHRRAEVGYELGHEYWGKGIMQEVMHVVLKHCFDDIGLNRIEAFIIMWLAIHERRFKNGCKCLGQNGNRGGRRRNFENLFPICYGYCHHF